MACPFYSKRDRECLIGRQDWDAQDEDEVGGLDLNPINLNLCLSTAGAYENCPIFQQQKIEEKKAY